MPFTPPLGFWPAAFPAEGVSGLLLVSGGGFTPLHLAYATQTLLPSISQSSKASFPALQFSSVSKSTKPNLRARTQIQKQTKKCWKNIPSEQLLFVQWWSHWPLHNSFFFSHKSCGHRSIKCVFQSLCGGLFSQAHHDQCFRQNWGG